MSTVPNKACAMPTPQRMKYFHAASIDSGVRYIDTSSTVVNVAASIATHSTPRLLVDSASSIENKKHWYIAWYKRSRALVTRPRSTSWRMYGREKIDVVKPTNAVR